MGVSYVCVFILFILIECTRFFMVYTYPNDKRSITLDSMVRTFTDERDSGPLVLTHIYLLIGCMLPLMIHLFTPKKGPIFGTCHGETLGPLLGVLILGVGDTMASLVGVYMGKNKWSYKTKKTVEGTIGAITSVLLTGTFIVLLRCSYQSVLLDQQFIGWIISTIVTCLLEATTNQIDNLVLPIFQFALMQMLCS
jgi:dolichol kinase